MPRSNKPQDPIYEAIVAHGKKAKRLQAILSLLQWDQETHMPLAGGKERSEHIALLSRILHQHLTDPQYEELLSKKIHIETGELHVHCEDKEQIILTWLARDYRKRKQLPLSFVEQLAQVSSEAQQIWAIARAEDNISLFLPYLKILVELNQEKSSRYDPNAHHPYDPLLDDFEPFLSVGILDPLFTELHSSITSLVSNISSHQSKHSTTLSLDSPVHYDPSTQWILGKHLLESMGCSPNTSRLDSSIHPFCMSLHPSDCRITARANPHDGWSLLSAILHEGGHALYEMGLPETYYGTPIGEPASLGIHESQARFWESCIGRHPSFLTYMLPKFFACFPENSHADRASIVRHLHHVQPSLIRIEADDVTYSLHILVRYQIEKGLLLGTYSVEDLPEIWNEQMQQYLGIVPTSNREGCLQDIHWSMGAFGYFPTYALGNLYAAQFFEAFEHAHPDWGQSILKENNLSCITQWLRRSIHEQGRLLRASALCEAVTGSPLSVAPYLRQLERRFCSNHGIY